jgi:hypothetical protein
MNLSPDQITIAITVYSSWFAVRRGFQGQSPAPRQFVLSRQIRCP